MFKWIALAVVGFVGLWVLFSVNGLAQKDEYVNLTYSGSERYAATS